MSRPSGNADPNAPQGAAPIWSRPCALAPGIATSVSRPRAARCQQVTGARSRSRQPKNAAGKVFASTPGPAPDPSRFWLNGGRAMPKSPCYGSSWSGTRGRGRRRFAVRLGLGPKFGLDIAIGAVFYTLAGLGVTGGFHRPSYSRTGPTRPSAGSRSRWLQPRVSRSRCRRSGRFPSIAGTTCSATRSTSSTRRSTPTRRGESGRPSERSRRGSSISHMGWLFRRERTNPDGFAPDMVNDPAMQWLDKHYAYLLASSLIAPAILGGLISWSWHGALTAFFWAGLVRVALLHHVTFSVNSICHMIGDRPFQSRRQGRQLLAAGHPQLRRILAQLSPRRPELRAPWRHEGPDRYHRPPDLDLREAGLGLDVRWPDMDNLNQKLAAS